MHKRTHTRAPILAKYNMQFNRSLASWSCQEVRRSSGKPQTEEFIAVRKPPAGRDQLSGLTPTPSTPHCEISQLRFFRMFYGIMCEFEVADEMQKWRVARRCLRSSTSSHLLHLLCILLLTFSLDWPHHHWCFSATETPPPIESRKRYQSVDPSCLDLVATILRPRPKTLLSHKVKKG